MSIRLFIELAEYYSVQKNKDLALRFAIEALRLSPRNKWLRYFVVTIQHSDPEALRGKFKKPNPDTTIKLFFLSPSCPRILSSPFVMNMATWLCFFEEAQAAQKLLKTHLKNHPNDRRASAFFKALTQSANKPSDETAQCERT